MTNQKNADITDNERLIFKFFQDVLRKKTRFWGEISVTFQAGKIINFKRNEIIKPEEI